MSMQRTNVYADAEDLSMIKKGAARCGLSEAEIIRRGVHIAALSVRSWETPFLDDDDLVDLGAPIAEDDIQHHLHEAAEDKDRRIERNQ